MPTDLDLANEALALIGQDRVPSLEQTLNNKAAQACNVFMSRIKTKVLRARDWNCARKRAQLDPTSPTAFDNESGGEWRFAYRTPPDCLTVRRFVNERTRRRSSFSWEVDQDGKRILYCNLDKAKIVYTSNITDVNKWDALLFSACARMLAAALAASFSRDLKLADMFLKTAYQEFDEAVGVDEAEGPFETETSTQFLDVRIGGSTGYGPLNTGGGGPTNVNP